MSDPRARLQQHILEQSPRLGPDDTFCFDCHPGISCFNHCCADVNIFLSPYDVLRMKRRLGMTSSQFLDTYTILPVHKDMKTPAVVLKMDAGTKRCPFLTDEGCGIYSDRPWPCRMYPLGLASQKDTPDGWRGDRFYFVLKEEGCKGGDEPRQPFRAAVGEVRRVRVDAVVAPAAIPWKGRHRHQLDRGDAEPFQFRQFGDQAGEGARARPGIGVPHQDPEAVAVVLDVAEQGNGGDLELRHGVLALEQLRRHLEYSVHLPVDDHGVQAFFAAEIGGFSRRFRSAF